MQMYVSWKQMLEHNCTNYLTFVEEFYSLMVYVSYIQMAFFYVMFSPGGFRYVYNESVSF